MLILLKFKYMKSRPALSSVFAFPSGHNTQTRTPPDLQISLSLPIATHTTHNTHQIYRSQHTQTKSDRRDFHRQVHWQPASPLCFPPFSTLNPKLSPILDDSVDIHPTSATILRLSGQKLLPPPYRCRQASTTENVPDFSRVSAKFVSLSSTIATTTAKPSTSTNTNTNTKEKLRKMVTLMVATSTDPASINPVNALLAMPGWNSGPPFQDMKSFANGEVRVVIHGKSIVKEDNLDSRWEEATGEVVEEVIFFSKHTAVSNRPALTVHPIGVPHLREGDVPPQGGKPGWAAPPSPRIGPWLRLLKKIAESHNLVPEFEITLEGTHHGPVTNKPTMFLEIGSTEDYWKRQDAAQVMALLVWEGLGLGGGAAVGNWSRDSDKYKVLLGIGGGHYAPRHMDIVLKDGVWVGHLLSGYSIPMEDPAQSKGEGNAKVINGTWREAIKAAFEATRVAFPGGEILAHLDQKSFKSWQKNAIISFLGEQNIKIGKPNDFY